VGSRSGTALAAVVAGWFVAISPSVAAEGPEEVSGETTGGTSKLGSPRERRRSRGDGGFSGTIRTGAEYDTNVHRTGLERSVGDVLTRYFAVLEGELPAAEEGRLALDLRHGGKLFAREHASDTLLTEARLEYRHRLGRHAYAMFAANTKDRLERRRGGADVPHQDYNRGGGEFGVGVGLGPVEGFLTGGWRYFAFRPNPASSNHGPQGTLGVSVDLDERLRARAQYTVAHRIFRAIRFVRREGEGGDPVVRRDQSGALRNDRLHIGRIGSSFRGAFIVSLHYQLLRNDSNSYGQELTRHGIELRGTAPLPWQLYLSGELQVQRTNYGDPLFLSADLEVDEENRNSAVVSLARVFGEHWEMEAQYRLFIEELGASSDYRRQTASLGVGYVF